MYSSAFNLYPTFGTNETIGKSFGVEHYVVNFMLFNCCRRTDFLKAVVFTYGLGAVSGNKLHVVWIMDAKSRQALGPACGAAVFLMCPTQWLAICFSPAVNLMALNINALSRKLCSKS